jgi:hypothetical protein
MCVLSGCSIATPQRLCHLPLAMDVLRRSKILDIIDAAIPQHRLSEVSTCECVAVILSGVYVGVHSLWRIREGLAPYDMATVMQDPTFDLERSRKSAWRRPWPEALHRPWFLNPRIR